MAKYKFTQSQFDEIYLLLQKRPTESRDEQKKTRARIRKLGFMISDYFTGFTCLDFKKLVSNGEIEISKDSGFGAKTSIEKNLTKPTSPSTKNRVSKKALSPVIDKETEYLILGTMPGEESLTNQEYYNNPKNQFWNIISVAFNKGKQFRDYSEKLDTIKRHKIGLWDVLDTCDREGSLDINIKNQTLNDFEKLFKDYPNIKTIIFNGQDSRSYFNSMIHNNGPKIYLQLTSTSSANTHKTLAQKIQEWKSAVTGKSAKMN